MQTVTRGGESDRAEQAPPLADHDHYRLQQRRVLGSLFGAVLVSAAFAVGIPFVAKTMHAARSLTEPQAVFALQPWTVSLSHALAIVAMAVGATFTLTVALALVRPDMGQGHSDIATFISVATNASIFASWIAMAVSISALLHAATHWADDLVAAVFLFLVSLVACMCAGALGVMRQHRWAMAIGHERRQRQQASHRSKIADLEQKFGLAKITNFGAYRRVRRSWLAWSLFVGVVAAAVMIGELLVRQPNALSGQVLFFALFTFGIFAALMGSVRIALVPQLLGAHRGNVWGLLVAGVAGFAATCFALAIVIALYTAKLWVAAGMTTILMVFVFAHSFSPAMLRKAAEQKVFELWRTISTLESADSQTETAGT